ncbi:hypothetical protein [Nitrosospira multiformis]|uniref:Uncharacterized protein n=1 Tax=Nitrosospira multiformis (strain ATCC 25196 / NCIMB 11849 / C 71) TaxID=323848 RepID=Q2YCQ1_NITMU|nr:hypothetical protein [Nitrosospira multiformis]ABB73470.1 hypothetical protein Nmul_A0162 [Nitrosospira multiformis ATCC 25196]
MQTDLWNEELEQSRELLKNFLKTLPEADQQITLIRVFLRRIESLATGSIYKIFSRCIQYLGTSRAVFFPDAIFVDEISLAHLFAVDYDIAWIVNVGYFPLAGQHKYPWQKPDWSDHL